MSDDKENKALSKTAFDAVTKGLQDVIAPDAHWKIDEGYTASPPSYPSDLKQIVSEEFCSDLGIDYEKQQAPLVIPDDPYNLDK